MTHREHALNRILPMTVVVVFLTTVFAGCLSLTAAPPPDPWHGPPWMTDYDAARRRAESERKCLLVHFSGSDWSEWCVRLHREVFTDPNFISACTNALVLVVLDFPAQPEHKAAIAEPFSEQYARLRGEFTVGAFPTVILTDTHGMPFGRFGYTEGDSSVVAARVKTLLAMKTERDRAIAVLESQCPTGVERARQLHSILASVPPNIADMYYRDMMAEIVALDAENEAELRLPYRVRLQRLTAVDAVRKGRIGDAIQVYGALISEEKPTGQLLQDLCLEQSTLYAKSNDPIGQSRCLEVALMAERTGNKALEIHALLKELGPKVRALKAELYAGQVLSTMGAHVDHPLEHAYDSNVTGTYYLSDRSPQAGDIVALILDTARDVNRVGVYTGHSEGEGGLPSGGVLEVSPDGQRFQTVAKIQHGRGQARISGAKLKVVRIRVTEPQEQPVMVREFLLD